MEQVTKTVAALNEYGFSGKYPGMGVRWAFNCSIDISMFECLIRPHEVSTQQKPVDISRTIVRLQDADLKKEERRQRQIANAIVRNAAKRKREEEAESPSQEVGEDGSEAAPTKRQKTEGSAETSTEQQPSGASTQPGSSTWESTQMQVVSRVIPEVRGHTSYLTFAIKLPMRSSL